MKALRIVGWIVAWVLALGCAAWALGALAFDFPRATWRPAATGVWGIAFLAALFVLRGQVRKLAGIFFGFVVVLAWWLTLKPANDRPWQGDVAQTAWAEINGDTITLHNVRNFDYRTETDYTPHWETRTVQLSQITGLDLAINYWGSPWMAHPIASFQFADSAHLAPVCFSIETRKEIGESYSAIGGIYRQYELIYVVADERDVIRVRTNYRKGEDIYLYRTTLPPEKARGRFLEYLRALNTIREHPRWYNAVTMNCTTSIRQQHKTADRRPWDWRILINGKGDEMLYEQGGLVTGGLSFPELKQRSLSNAAAVAADRDPAFSQRIREGHPGFSAP